MNLHLSKIVYCQIIPYFLKNRQYTGGVAKSLIITWKRAVYYIRKKAVIYKGTISKEFLICG